MRYPKGPPRRPGSTIVPATLVILAVLFIAGILFAKSCGGEDKGDTGGEETTAPPATTVGEKTQPTGGTLPDSGGMWIPTK